MTAINETEVQRRIERLRAQFGRADLRHEEVTDPPDRFADAAEAARDGWVGDAGAFVTDDGRALFIRHAADPERWGVPGGGHEPGETLAETARREVREETGIDCSLTGLALLRRKVIVHEGDPDRRVHMLTAVFDAAYEGGGIEVGDDEVLEARWFDEAPPAVADVVADRVDGWAAGR